MSGSQLGTPGVQNKVLISSLSTLISLFVVFLLGWGFVALAPPDSHVAAWWPAAGVSTLLVLRLHRSHRAWGVLGIVIVTAISNMVGGRDLVVSLFFGIANASEAWIVVAILTQRGRARPALDQLATAYRLCIAVAAGAIVIGLLAGLTIVVFDGGSLVPTWIGVSAAHATAVLIILPFALIPPQQLAKVHIVEITIQFILLVAVLFYVFGPGRSLPLSFLPLPVIAWAAFRFPTRVALFEVVGIALSISFLTSAGGGPFDQSGGVGGDPSTLIQIFLLAVTSFVLLAASSQNEHRIVNARLADREAILRGGFVGSRVGLLIVEAFRHGFVVLESNEMASAVIANESDVIPDGDGEVITLWDGALAARVNTAVRQRVDQFSWQPLNDSAHSDVDVLVAELPSSAGTRFSIQFVDTSAAMRTAEAQQLALEQEQAATARLTELSRQKEEFVASASHELRTPITSIIGYVELLEEEQLDEFQASSVATIARNARRLADLVEDLLELGRPRDLSKSSSTSNLSQVAAEVAQSLEPFSEVNAIAVALSAPDQITVAVPAIDLDRILTNLMTNAIKFTPAGGSIQVGVSSTDSAAVVTVSDSGLGMTADVVEHIFERFYRAPEAEARGITGTGLGLPLVQGLVSKHHGIVGVESTVGEGTTFTVTFPLGVSSETS
ncbi:ATP-binding protein [Salinibacterium sp. M195]|uniref:ATP-binding protein n=1 Tax=Salinibacterium sp. M195 TaxID=2583374 RepID=UPI001C63A6E3|nr:ATP-binding protein [Salinibacterium sp. M195]QYH34921.1 hypothetical protein FFT87_02570 [Salinibacterium sp. M195]